MKRECRSVSTLSAIVFAPSEHAIAIVQREHDAETLELAQRAQDQFGIQHQRAFGQFEFQKFPRQLAIAEDAAHHLPDVVLLELARREVDCH